MYMLYETTVVVFEVEKILDVFGFADSHWFLVVGLECFN